MNSHRLAAWCCWLCVSALSACEPWSSAHAPETVTDDWEQDALVVSPAVLDLGEWVATERLSVEESFTIANAGTEPLVIHGHDEVVGLAGDDAEGVFEVDAEPIFELMPGEEQVLTVRFEPRTEDEWTAELRVNYGVEVLSLRGSATAPVIELAVSPPPATPLGCSSEAELTVYNTGSEPLEIGGITLTHQTHFTLDGALPEPVGGGQSASALVRFTPAWSELGGGEKDVVIAVESNDPSRPSVSISLSGLAYEGEQVSESFTYAPGIETDLLFVVDTDGVMGTIHAGKGGQALPALIDALDEGQVALHAASVTGTQSCPSASPPWVTSDDPVETRIASLAEGFEPEAAGGSDQLALHAIAALAGDTPGGCLDGLLRAGAILHVVVIAGEADRSGLGTDETLAALVAVAPEAGDHVVTAVVATDAQGCSGASYGEGYVELAAATGGLILDLCEEDWTSGFERVAALSVAASHGGLRRTLQRTPLVESLQIRVDGVSWDDWTWDASDNAVVFAEETAPQSGSAVEIDYTAAVDCDAP